MLPAEPDALRSIVSRTLRIDDVTIGNGKDYLMRYRGRLYEQDSAKAYDTLAAALRPYEITPLFRAEEDQHVVLLMSGVLRPSPSNPLVNLVMFVLTVLSVFLVSTLFMNSSIADGLVLTASLMAILLAHEFGHYLAGRYHHTSVTLPYFIPLPLPPLGTMGAFIRMKEPPKNRRVLLDIGIAGPLAGLVVAIPVLIIGLMLSKVGPIPARLPQGTVFSFEGNSVLYLLAKLLVFGRLLPASGDYQGLAAIQHWIVYFFTGRPLPLGGVDVMISPMAWAGWVGLLVTSLNLVPAGQFDGGHLVYVLFGKRVNTFLPFILVALVALGFVWAGWWLWAALVFFLGRLHAEPLDQITPLDPARKALAVLGIVVFILVFMPVPLA